MFTASNKLSWADLNPLFRFVVQFDPDLLKDGDRANSVRELNRASGEWSPNHPEFLARVIEREKDEPWVMTATDNTRAERLVIALKSNLKKAMSASTPADFAAVVSTLNLFKSAYERFCSQITHYAINRLGREASSLTDNLMPASITQVRKFLRSFRDSLQAAQAKADKYFGANDPFAVKQLFLGFIASINAAHESMESTISSAAAMLRQQFKAG